jgi:hypothetical protein
MNNYGRALLALMVVLTGIYPSTLPVNGTELTEANYQEYISNFIGAASYQLPEPASTLSSLLFAAPEGTKGLLRAWAYQNWLSSERNYQNAADSGSTSQMNYYSDQSNRWQAVLTCLTGDCSNMQKLEAGPQTQQGTGGTETAGGPLIANGTSYSKGSLLVGPISLPANWTDPQDILFLDQGRPYIIVGEGTCSLWDNPPEPDGVDSCFCYAKWRIGDTPQIWGQLELTDPSVHLSDLIEKNTGKPAEYNPSHIYEAVVIGEGKMLKARVFDGGGYSDNHGELRISVYNAIASS